MLTRKKKKAKFPTAASDGSLSRILSDQAKKNSFPPSHDKVNKPDTNQVLITPSSLPNKPSNGGAENDQTRLSRSVAGSSIVDSKQTKETSVTSLKAPSPEQRKQSPVTITISGVQTDGKSGTCAPVKSPSSQTATTVRSQHPS